MVNRIRNRKKSVIIFISIAVALVGLVFLISAIVVSCNRDRRDELVFYIYVGPEREQHPRINSKSQAEKLISDGELSLLCELHNKSHDKIYTLNSGKVDKYFYIKYGVKGEDRLFDCYYENSNVKASISILTAGKDIVHITFEQEKLSILPETKYEFNFAVSEYHDLYKENRCSCTVTVN